MEPEPEPDPESGGYVPLSLEHMKPSEGTIFYKIMGIMILLKRHIMITYLFDLDSLNNQQFFSWDDRELTTHSYKESLDQYLKDSSNISFIFLRVARGCHLNTLIFFKDIRCIFRLEPNGLQKGGYNPSELDLELESEFSYLREWKYVKHSDTNRTGSGCQTLEQYEANFRKSDDPKFCTSWNFWMIEYVIKNLHIINSEENLPYIYTGSYAELDRRLDPETPPALTKIREFNVELLRECLEYLYEFLPVFAHLQMKTFEFLHEVYALFTSGDSFDQETNSDWHNIFSGIMYGIYNILEPISQVDHRKSILTIHGFDLELCSEIMKGMGATNTSKRSTKRMKASSKKKKKKKTKRKKKRKSKRKSKQRSKRKSKKSKMR